MISSIQADAVVVSLAITLCFKNDGGRGLHLGVSLGYSMHMRMLDLPLEVQLCRLYSTTHRRCSHPALPT